MSNFYNIFGEYNSSENKNIETFATTKTVTERINELSSALKSGEIKEEEIKKEITELKTLEENGKFSVAEKKSFAELIKDNVRLTDGINLVGNLELGGIIKARGFHLSDGSAIKSVVQEKEKLAVPIDKQGNINLAPKTGKKMTITKTDITNLNIPKEGRISFGNGQDSDPYHIRKVGNTDANHLRVTLNDNNNESLQVWGDSCKTDKCNPNGGTMKHAFFTNGNAHHKGDIIMDGGNNWIFHTPDDGRHHLYIAPSKTKGKSDWNWNNQFRLQNDGSAHIQGSLNVKNAKNADNPTGWGSHFNYQNKSQNYIRGKTELRGEVNLVDNTKGLNIAERKNGNNPTGYGTHFNYKGQGLNYIRGKTEMRGEVNYVDKSKGINIANGKNSRANPSGATTHLNYRGRGENHIRGMTYMQEIQVQNPKNGNNPSGGHTHFNHLSGRNFIRGTTEINGPSINLIANKGINVTSQRRVSSFGSQSSGWCHITTNAPQFYMNRSLQVNGAVSSYNNKPLNANRGVNAPHYSRIGGDWLRINPEGNSVGRVAAYGGFSINDVRGGKGGLGVGYWGYPGRGNIRATGNIQANNGLRITGGRTHIQDAERSGRLRVGAAWRIPGIYSEDNHDVVVGCRSNRNVHLGRPNLVRIDRAGNIHLPRGRNIFIGGQPVLKTNDLVVIESQRGKQFLRNVNGSTDIRFQTRNKGNWERMRLIRV